MKTDQVRTVPVFDGLLRFIHAWNGLAIVGLIATGLTAEEFEQGPWLSTLWHWHISLGYALIGGLVARLLWGFMGPATARFSDFWHQRAWKEMARSFRPPSPRAGHDALASLAFIVVYLVLIGMAITGLALAAIEYNMGPLSGILGDAVMLKHTIKEPHEAMYVVVAGFIGLHLAALAYHAWRGEPVAAGMISGHLPVPAAEAVAPAAKPAPRQSLRTEP